MTKTKSEQDSEIQQRGRKLSPELNEFLHMLNALEGQLGEKLPAATAR